MNKLNKFEVRRMGEAKWVGLLLPFYVACINFNP